MNIFRKLLLWVFYFVLLYPISLVLKRLYGEDSANLYYWPFKFFFSSTYVLFFAMAQPLTMGALAEIYLNRRGTSYEETSYVIAWIIFSCVFFGIFNVLFLVLRHSRTSEHPLIQLRFDALFIPFRRSSLFS